MTDETTAKALHDEGVPEDAMRRLSHLQPGKGGIFTSDLTVNEFLLITEARRRWRRRRQARPQRPRLRPRAPDPAGGIADLLALRLAFPP